jgi:hypothetical protein
MRPVLWATVVVLGLAGVIAASVFTPTAAWLRGGANSAGEMVSATIIVSGRKDDADDKKALEKALEDQGGRSEAVNAAGISHSKVRRDPKDKTLVEVADDVWAVMLDDSYFSFRESDAEMASC